MCTRRTPTPPSAWGAGPGAARHQRRVQLRVSTRALDGWLTAAPTRPSTQAGGHKPTRTSIPRLDSGPQVIERNAVIEGSAVDDLAVPQLQESRVAVLIGLAVVGDPAAVPADDHGVAVGMDRADRDRAEGRCWQESCPKGRQHLVDELLPAPYSLEASECPPIRQTSSGGEHVADRAGSLLPCLEGLADGLPIGSMRALGASTISLLPGSSDIARPGPTVGAQALRKLSRSAVN